MSGKFIFQNARIKNMENKLLTSQNIQRLLDCTKVEDAYKALVEFGFDANLTKATAEDGSAVIGDDALFAQEEHKNISLLKEMNVENVLDPLLLEGDYLNAKALVKAFINKKEAVLMEGGIYKSDTIQDAIEMQNYEYLSFEMGDALAKILKLHAEDALSPRQIDNILDKAMYSQILRLVKKNNEFKKYYVTKIDYINISSFIRCKKLALDERFFKEAFIEGGVLEQDTFLSVFESPLDALKDKCKGTEYEKVVNNVVDSNNMVAYEVAVDNALLKLWKDNFNDMFSPAPIVAYYLTRTTEIKLAKLIVAGIKNNVDPSLIKERMREIYA